MGKVTCGAVTHAIVVSREAGGMLPRATVHLSQEKEGVIRVITRLTPAEALDLGQLLFAIANGHTSWEEYSKARLQELDIEVPQQ